MVVIAKEATPAQHMTPCPYRHHGAPEVDGQHPGRMSDAVGDGTIVIRGPALAVVARRGARRRVLRDIRTTGVREHGRLVRRGHRLPAPRVDPALNLLARRWSARRVVRDRFQPFRAANQRQSTQRACAVGDPGRQPVATQGPPGVVDRGDGHAHGIRQRLIAYRGVSAQDDPLLRIGEMRSSRHGAIVSKRIT